VTTWTADPLAETGRSPAV